MIPSFGTRSAPARTPLREVSPGLLMKFELHNPGGSHKWRSAKRIVDLALARQDIVPGRTTILEKTGGNFGFGLVLACAEHRLKIDLVVGPSFSVKKRRWLESYGANCVGDDMMRDGMSPPDVTDWMLAHQGDLGKSYYFTNQHFNVDGMDAHELETGREIVDQISDLDGVEEVTFVSCAGTGAHMAGISRALSKSGLLARAIFVDPEGCDSRNGVFTDHPFEGISVMVPPLIDWSLVHERRCVSVTEMRETQLQFARETGFLIGNTSAACLKIGNDVSKERAAEASHKVLVIAYDHALWYVT